MRTPKFDKYQFGGRRAKPASADSGLAFYDFGRMHVQRRERTAERRLETPKWAVNDLWLRELLVVYLEQRFYVTPKPRSSYIRRLKIAGRAAKRYAPRKRADLREWIQDYKIVSEQGFDTMSDDEALDKAASLKENAGQYFITADIARACLKKKKLHDLDIQIQNVDTDLVLTERGHAQMIAGIVYYFYRLGWDSVGVAEQLGLKPPHIRQVLFRLQATWDDSLAAKYQRKERAISTPRVAPTTEEMYGPIFAEV